ncbi:LD-carboxypeptidase [Streptomyces longwoodensis]|uniref:LD-carboxypeptidase n=1 Tax=Streptomyces longwoodensis TaxID=68231 RepID=UPI0033EEE17C
MSCVWPDAVPTNARVGVWAPSSPGPVVFPRRFTRGLDALRARGYQVEQGASCAASTGPGTLSPRELAEELVVLLESCDAVVAAVGGWTLTPVLPHIDWDRVGRAGKPLVGYSDVTSVLNLTAERAGLVAFHGPMVISEWGEAGGPWPYTVEEFDTVTGAGCDWREHSIRPAGSWSDERLFWDREDVRRRTGNSGDQPVRTVAPGSARGPLWGGSLVVLSLLAGTPLWPEPVDGSVVFLEAEGIAPDELWARLEQFRLAGVLRRAGGVVLGKIGNPSCTASGYADFDAVVRSCVPDGLPVVAGFDLGHADPMCTLPVGATARLECPADGSPGLVLLRDAPVASGTEAAA